MFYSILIARYCIIAHSNDRNYKKCVSCIALALFWSYSVHSKQALAKMQVNSSINKMFNFWTGHTNFSITAGMARRMEKIEGGHGILLDDVVAGIYAGLAMLIMYNGIVPFELALLGFIALSFVVGVQKYLTRV